MLCEYRARLSSHSDSVIGEEALLRISPSLPSPLAISHTGTASIIAANRFLVGAARWVQVRPVKYSEMAFPAASSVPLYAPRVTQNGGSVVVVVVVVVAGGGG